ncbi:MAG: WD40 repeat domain-containing protein, partial [Bacteroidales bacterium]|nr:WD40 repeat domain-containing protein [Bacteroidales bacterium]
AMKAKNQYEDKSLNLRLAKSACDMNRKGGSDQINADLYDAMLFAMEQNNIIEPLTIPSGTYKAFAINNQGHIITFSTSGVIDRYKISGNGKTERVDLGPREIGYRVPVESASFLNPTTIVYSAKDRKSYLVDVNTRKRTQLPVVNDYIQSASMLASGQNSDAQFAAAYVGGKVAIMNHNGGEAVAQKDFKVNITDIYYHDPNSVYVLFHDGSLIKWNPIINDVKNVLPATLHYHAFKMAAINNRKQLAVCFSNGDIKFVNLANNTQSGSMVGGHSKLENLLYDPKSGILALSSADKRISLINTKDLNEKPLVIEEHSLGNSKVKCMSFNNKGVLFALTDDNKLRFWDTNPQIYANGLSKMNLPPLSDTEWNLIMGREFSER